MPGGSPRKAIVMSFVNGGPVASILHRLLRLGVVLSLMVSVMTVGTVLVAPAARAATPCDAPVTNKVACENTKAGTANWMVDSLDDSIAGFTTDISATPGSTMSFKIKTTASSYRVDILRLGYYGGTGARQVATVSRGTAQTQPSCLTTPATGLTDCGNWAVSVTWAVPSDAVSGLYYAVLHRNDTQGENELPFVIRDDSSHSDVQFQTSDETWQAYNRYTDTGSDHAAGNSLYFGNGPGVQGSAYQVSYNRPITGGGDENFIFNSEYPMLRFMEANGYDVSYSTDVDSARRGNLITNHKVLMAVGHDEYWSNEQRANIEAARGAGVNLAFMTGNDAFWKTRFGPSTDASATAWRTVTCYKETKAGQVDPNSTTWTGTWRDPRMSPPKDGGRPENSLLGNLFTVNGRRDDSMQVPAAYGKMRLWRNTPLATAAVGSTYTFQPGTLGYEWNSVEDNGFQPPGVAQLSQTIVAITGQYVLQNYGDVYDSGTKTHALTLYRASSGALVFGAGTVQWAWGLDDNHAFQTATPTSDVRIKQATVNLMADMGVQPATLQSGVTAATKSTDTTAPTVAITSTPAATVGTPYTFSGTVSDGGGGQVSGVEVSFDGGATYHASTWTAGSGTWSYTFTPTSSAALALRARAVDDSANISSPVSGTATTAARQCPCGIWTDSTIPGTPDTADNSALELGVKWRASTAGFVRGIRFYKGAGDIGTHTGSLWSSTGQLLGTGTFSNETATGWQTLALPTSVAVAADTTYVVSYFAPKGHYASDAGYFTSKGASLEPLTALQSGTDGTNGVFRDGSTGFPTQSFGDANYWVDVVWAQSAGPDTRPPAVKATSPGNGAGSVPLSGTVTVTFDEAIAPASAQFTITKAGGGAVTGTTSVSSDGMTVSFLPSPQLAAATGYSVSLNAKDIAGNSVTPTVAFSFTTGTPRAATCPCTVWDDFTRPAVESANDPGAVEIGTKFRFDRPGTVNGIRFYKGTGNIGTHTGSLWSSTGTKIATGTFTNETATGWQSLTFDTPASVQANTTYVASYYAPSGHYAADAWYFNGKGADYQYLHALADNVDGPDGVYKYAAGGGFPTSTYQSGNYWVDAIFAIDPNADITPPSVTSQSPAANATGVALTSPVSATFNEALAGASVQFTLADPGGAKLAGAVSLSADQKTVTFTPAAPFAAATPYTASVRASDVAGNAMAAPVTWTFTPVTTQTCPCSLFSTGTVPTTVDSGDPGAYEMGVRFSPSANGSITGVKFYKSAANTGTHTGSLWSNTGALLGTGTFSSESATGWQTLTFATPVPVVAGATYAASYTTPNGHYSADAGYFQRTAVASPPLSAPSAAGPNGVYRSGTGFPNATYQGGNYWVDVVYNASADSTPPAVATQSPPSGATGVSLTAPVSATFDKPVAGSSVQFSVSDPGGAKLAGSAVLSADQKTVTFTPAAPFAAATPYTASVSAADLAGNAMSAPVKWSFTPVTTQACPCSLFSTATVPTLVDSGDPGAYEMGVRFTPSANGSVTAVKFYKSAANTGMHTGSLWSDAGVQLATGTFSNETASGWQMLTFATPVPLVAGTTYVASYTTPNGHYSANSSYFETGGVTSPPLSAPATGGSLGSNGVYRSGTGFPTSTYRGGNYWIDVVFVLS